MRLEWKRITRRKKPQPDVPWERALGRFSSHLVCLLPSGQWQSWMLCWNDVDNGKAWSGTSPTLEAAKIFAQHIEDEMAKIWTLSAVTGEVKRIVTEVAANHGPMFASTDYDKALGRQAWKDAFLKVTKQSGNVVDIVKTKNTVSQLSGHRNFGIWLRRVLRRAL